jgi:hypothetical protein
MRNQRREGKSTNRFIDDTLVLHALRRTMMDVNHGVESRELMR